MPELRDRAGTEDGAPPRLDAKAQEVRAALERQLVVRLGRSPDRAGRHDWFVALAELARDRLLPRWEASERAVSEADARRVAYLSMEYHVGRLLRASLHALGLEGPAAAALASRGLSLSDLCEEESDPGLGSGGLGRLAACFLDSLATCELPAIGYGLRYELGLFKQHLEGGHQSEEPDRWLERGFPWEVARPTEAVRVSFHGRVDSYRDGDGRMHYRWTGTDDLLAVPYDVPIAGYGVGGATTLRLWSTRPVAHGVDGRAFREGDYAHAMADRARAAALTTFLYPDDGTPAGQALRLQQQFLLASASLQDLLRRHPPTHEGWSLGDHTVLQLNDTHPVLSIPELMRLLMDEHGFPWEQAWEVTRHAFAYTNHTLLPEALESWPQELMGWLFPRHLQIVQEIDRRLRRRLREVNADGARTERMAVLEQGRVRMANLAMEGSFAVNGVAALHTRLLEEGLLSDWHELHPERFSNKTNGITPRRWLRQCNPGLAALIDDRIGPGWDRDLERLRALEPLADDPGFRAAYRAVKLANKRALAEVIQREVGTAPVPEGLFDVLIKRFHEYKRQLLLALWTIHRYRAIKTGALQDPVPRTVIFAGKAAPNYHAAKEVIRLILHVAAITNNDRETRDLLRVAFLPNYRVSLAEAIVPAADVSEQISTAGYEASGTGNMKLALNGALTLGTLDGANVEIKEQVGDENVFIFGLRAEQVKALRAEGYDPRRAAEANADLGSVLDAIAGDVFAEGGFPDLVDGLLDYDPYMVLADFPAYVEAQERVDAAWRDPEEWTRRAILNTARMGYFSSDRTIRQYAEEIWKISPVSVRGAGS